MLFRALKTSLTLLAAAAMMAGGILSVSAPAAADEGALARGGQLYDKWFKLIKAPTPKDTHPAWPAANTKKKGNATNRCKSCHGWDGLGKDGAYAKGSYKTGIKGVNGMIGADNAKIIAVLKDKTHGYAGKMDEKDFQDLALFISKGQVDMMKYIDYATKKPKGNAAKGKDYFNTICIGCHGAQGFEPKDMKKTLGKQMGNPQEVLHKILNGHPGEPMPGLRALDRQIPVDIMAYLTTLPKSK
jgi:thiosulfate dehydrogenase